MTAMPLPATRTPRDTGASRHVAILLAVWRVPAAFMVFQMYATPLINGTRVPPVRALIPALAEWLIWVPLTPMIMRLARRYPLTWPPGVQPVAVHALGIVAAAVLRGTVYGASTYLVADAVRKIPFFGYLWRVSLGWLPMGALVWGAIIAAGAALDYARRLNERELRDAELREQLARAELATLRARLHPHFLFNALHSIGALVRAKENAAAVRVVAELSELLREAISRDAPDMVRLSDELAFVRRYLDIEAVRFADRLRVEWDLRPGVDGAVVPSLVVQPLVENAMRHAVAASWNAGRLRISARRDGGALAIDPCSHRRISLDARNDTRHARSS
jgi:two-component system, LytTR family, sensor kinase